MFDTTLHQIYFVAFAIFYAIVLQGVSKHAPFKTSSAFLKQPFCRLIVSVIILNFVPILYFSWFLTNLGLLGKIDLQNPYAFLNNVSLVSVVFALTLSTFGFQKIWYMSMIIGKNKFYTCNEKTDFQKKGIIFLDRHPLQYLFASIFYITLPSFFFYGLSEITSIISIGLLIVLITAAVMGYLAHRKYSSKYREFGNNTHTIIS